MAACAVQALRRPHLAPVAAICAASLLSACSLFDAHKDDYKRADRLPPLEIPPSLSAPQADDRFAIPDPKDVAASATYSEYAKARGLPTLPGGYVPGVGVDAQSTQAHIERDGAERWLVVNGNPDQVWNTIHTFLSENGYEIAAENATVGVMETQWLTSKPHVEDDGFLRNAINYLFTNDNSTSLRDRYRFRVEHGRKDGTTEVYVSHKGLEEVAKGNDSTIWQPRPNEPDKEAEMLKRLLVKFGVDVPAADKQLVAANVTPRATSADAADVANAATSASSAATVAATLGARGDGTPQLTLNEPYDRAWRRLGLALDKVGMAVQDQNRDTGVYFVQYSADKLRLPPGEAGSQGKGFGNFLASVGKSIWKKLTDTDTSTPDKPLVLDTAPSSSTAADAAGVKVPDGVYSVALARAGETNSAVTALDKDGKPLPADQSRKILAQLATQFR